MKNGLRGILIIFCLSQIGCGVKSTVTTPPTALAPGYLNTADQTMGEILQSAHALYTRLQQDSLGGKFVPTPKEMLVLNNLELALNTADPIYIAYHQGTVTQAQAQAAVNGVVQQQVAVQSLVGGK